MRDEGEIWPYLIHTVGIISDVPMDMVESIAKMGQLVYAISQSIEVVVVTIPASTLIWQATVQMVDDDMIHPLVDIFWVEIQVA